MSLLVWHYTRDPDHGVGYFVDERNAFLDKPWWDGGGPGYHQIGSAEDGTITIYERERNTKSPLFVLNFRPTERPELECFGADNKEDLAEVVTHLATFRRTHPNTMPTFYMYNSAYTHLPCTKPFVPRRIFG